MSSLEEYPPEGLGRHLSIASDASTLELGSSESSTRRAGRPLCALVARSSSPHFASSDSIPTTEVLDIAQSEKKCHGCERVIGVHRDCVNPSEEMEWAYADQRGNWCKDCHTVWRLCFQEKCVLANFKMYLQQTTHRARWDISRCAYWSLKAEGASRMQEVLMQKRIDMLTWFSNFAGVSFTQSRLKLLKDMTPTERRDLNPNRLVIVAARGEKRIGYFMEMPGRGRSGDSHHIFTPAADPRLQPAFSQDLETDSQEDLVFLSTLGTFLHEAGGASEASRGDRTSASELAMPATGNERSCAVRIYEALETHVKQKNENLLGGVLVQGRQ